MTMTQLPTSFHSGSPIRTFLDSHLRPIASTLGTLAIAAGIVLAAGLAAPVAQAQLASTPDQATPSDAPRWTNTFEMQVKTLIEALSHALQARGMQLIIAFANQSDADYPPHDAFAFETVRPALYDVLLDADNPDDVRILALSALSATGDVASGQTLLDVLGSVKDDPSERVERHVKIALGEKR